MELAGFCMVTYHHILLALAILSKDSSVPNMSIYSCFLDLIALHHTSLESSLFLFILKLSSFFLLSTMFHFHTT